MSALPVELIHRIQSLLPPEEAANTCLLSKSWLHAWYTIPTLRLIPPKPGIHPFKAATKYDRFIRTTLKRYHRDNMPIESFHLHTEGLYCVRAEDIKDWIQLAVLRNYCLKELSIQIWTLRNDILILPNQIFSSQNLDIISVRGCRDGNLVRVCFPLCTNPGGVIKCVSLRILDLTCVDITSDMFHNLLSTCTLLEKIRVESCKGLKKVKVKNLLHLSEMEIISVEKNDLWDIDTVPRLCSFSYYDLSWKKGIPFQIDSLARVTQLCIYNVAIDNSFFKTVESKFSVLETLTLKIGEWKGENMVITSVSLKWLTLNLLQSMPVINVQVDAPRLLSFTYTGNIPGLLFRSTAPEQVDLTFNEQEDLGRHSYFLKMREVLNLSSKYVLNLDYVLKRLKNIDVDELRRSVSLLPVRSVGQLTLKTCLDEFTWEQSRFFDAFFLIFHPSYIRSSYEIIRKMMEVNTTDLKEVQLKNPDDGKWEALTSSCLSALGTYRGHQLECKLNWFPQ